MNIITLMTGHPLLNKIKEILKLQQLSEVASIVHNTEHHGTRH